MEDNNMANKVEEQDHQHQQKAEWSQELARLEDEMSTLRSTLDLKTRHASAVRRKLGITVWKELSDDVQEGLKSVSECTVFQTMKDGVGNITKAVQDASLYQRTEAVFRSTTERTATVFESITTGISAKFMQLKSFEPMRSFESKVGSVYDNMKEMMSSARAGSNPKSASTSGSASGSSLDSASTSTFANNLNDGKSSTSLNSPNGPSTK